MGSSSWGAVLRMVSDICFVSPVTVPPLLYSGVHLFSECASFPYYMVTESEVMKLSILHLNKMYAL